MVRKIVRLRFNQPNTMKSKVPNKPGIYRFYDQNGKLLYVGHAKKLRHRIQSYRQKDCPKTHPTKPRLRKKIYNFSYTVMPKDKAKRKERNGKHKAKYNVL